MGALFSTFGIDWHLLVAQTANFLILAALLTWLLYKPVLKMVREREQVIARGVEEAEEASRKLAAADTEAGAAEEAARARAGSEREIARLAILAAEKVLQKKS